VLNLGRLRLGLLLLLYMGAEFSDVAVPFGATSEGDVRTSCWEFSSTGTGMRFDAVGDILPSAPPCAGLCRLSFGLLSWRVAGLYESCQSPTQTSVAHFGACCPLLCWKTIYLILSRVRGFPEQPERHTATSLAQVVPGRSFRPGFVFTNL
jgi:hypothetical protein